MERILAELEALRKRLVDNVNKEIDNYREMILNSGDLGMTERVFEVEYPIGTGTSIFKGRKPVLIKFPDKTISVRTWKNVVESILKEVVKDNANTVKLYDLCGQVKGKKRLILGTSSTDMHTPFEIKQN